MDDPEGDGEDHYNWKDPHAVADVLGKASTGDKQVTLSLRAGVTLPKGLLLLTWHDTHDYSLARHMGGHSLFDHWTAKPAANAADQTARTYRTSRKLHRPWRWPVEFERVIEDQGQRLVVELRQPLRVDIRPEWKVTLEIPGTEDGRPGKGYIEEVGIEGLRLEMAPHKPFAHLQDLGFNGLYFDRPSTAGCGTLSSTSRISESPFLRARTLPSVMWSSLDRSITMAFYVRNSSHDILIERFRIGPLRGAIAAAAQQSPRAAQNAHLLVFRFVVPPLA